MFDKLHIVIPSSSEVYRWLFYFSLILTLAAVIFAIFIGRQYFNSQNVEVVEREIKMFGGWSPLIIFVLIVLVTVIPPLPIPTTFLEIAAGIILKFIPGFLLVWVSLTVASMICFLLSKKIGRIFIGSIYGTSIYKFFREFIEKRGALAIFVTRATMSSPFNMSYLAGLMQMNTRKFFIATVFGILTESIIFVYLGTLITQHVMIRLFYIYILLISIGYIPSMVFLFISHVRERRKELKRI